MTIDISLTGKRESGDQPGQNRDAASRHVETRLRRRREARLGVCGRLVGRGNRRERHTPGRSRRRRICIRRDCRRSVGKLTGGRFLARIRLSGFADRSRRRCRLVLCGSRARWSLPRPLLGSRCGDRDRAVDREIAQLRIADRLIGRRRQRVLGERSGSGRHQDSRSSDQDSPTRVHNPPVIQWSTRLIAFTTLIGATRAPIQAQCTLTGVDQHQL